MENNDLAKIMILDSTAAHGQYISKMFQRECVLMTSNYAQHKLKEASKDATLIYVLSFIEELEELKKLTNSHFRNVVVCSERMDDTHVQSSKPFAFVSLNALKDKWIEAIFQALLDLNGPAVLPCLSSDHTVYKAHTQKNGEGS